MSNFVHLHVHSEYSLLDGANKVKELPKYAHELGMNAIAITDHGSMYGAIEFYKECKKVGIKPIIGCEVYTAPRSRTEKQTGIDDDYGHLILLAKNEIGYKNLIKIVSIGFTEGFYYKPRVDLETIEKYHDGIICLSACIGGDVPRLIIQNQYEKAKEIILWYKNIFKSDYYLELQSNTIPEQVIVNQKLVEFSKELGIEIVATNDAHYLKKEDAYNHEVLLCIQTGKKMSDENRMKFASDDFYIKSQEEMEQAFKNFPEAIENTNKIADKCNLEFEFNVTKLPNYDVPEEYKTHAEYLRMLCETGLEKRYGKEYNKELKDRLDYELSIIEKMGFVDYFLIVWDFIDYAKKNDIPVGPGRGSGAGSIAAYCLEITDIDPIKYTLLFERFLNPERISMPDFDIDFCYERRQEVIEYVGRKYGHDHVAQIITFGTMSARMVIRDVGRALDIPYADVDKLAKMIPFAVHMTIKQAMEQNKELATLYEIDEQTKKILDISMGLEGLPRHASTHAAGVVITNNPVDTYVPLYVNDGNISTQYTMTILEELGLLKMDFLGLRTLTVIDDAIKLVKQHRGIDVEFDKDMADSNVYKLWGEGKSVGIFQFESGGMTSFMKELKPDSLEDIIAGVSLYRPGPMDQIPRYIKSKNNPGFAEYTHPSLEPILNVTYGCMVYQEQVIQIVRDLAGYSLGRADLVRRAMGKKKLDVMAKERECFIHGETDTDGNVTVQGCVRNAIDEKSANKIFDEMSEFAKYAFNKSHAACYAVIAYRTAYLKHYYKEEFMAAILNSCLGNLDRVPEYIDECRRMNIEILKPDINKSFAKFTVDNAAIRFGMGSIKNVGIAAVEAITKEREENGHFKNFTDFCERMNSESVNKKCIESLIKAGVFDKLGQTRSTLLASFEGIIDTISNASKKTIEGQFNVFDMGNDKQKEELKYTYKTLEELSKKEILAMEKEILGLYISGHPLDNMREQITSVTNINSLKIANINEDEKNEYKDNQDVKYAGIITYVKKKYTKNNTIMAFVGVEDMYGIVELIVFESVYQRAVDVLLEGTIVIVEGRLSIREEEETKIVAKNIKILNNAKSKKEVNININNLSESKINQIKNLLLFFSGDKNNIKIKIGNENMPIYLTKESLEEIEELAGKERVIINTID